MVGTSCSTVANMGLAKWIPQFQSRWRRLRFRTSLISGIRTRKSVSKNGLYRLGAGAGFFDMKRLLAVIALIFVCSLNVQAQLTPEEPLLITSITGGELGRFTDSHVKAFEPVGQNKIFADRINTWYENSLPDEFNHCQSIRTNFSDRGSTATGLVSFTLSREAQVTVWMSDSLVGGVPAWVDTKDYKDNGYSKAIFTDFGGSATGYSAIKAAGAHVLDGATTDGNEDFPTYAISICSSSYQAFPIVAPAPTDKGEYRFLVSTGADIPESTTVQRGAVERVPGAGNDTAVSVDISDASGAGDCVSGTDYTAFSDKTANWADNVDGTVQGISGIVALDVSADCTLRMNLINPSSGFTAAKTMQTYTVTITNSESVANIFVDKSCSGCDATGDGSSGSPYQNAEKGMQQASPGDVVCLRNGTYDDHDNSNSIIKVTSGMSGTAGNPITIQPCAGHSPLIADAGAFWGIIAERSSYITVKNLEFGVVKNSCIYIAGGSSTKTGSHNWIIEDALLHDCGAVSAACKESNGRSGIFTNKWSRDVTIDSSTIHSIGRIRNAACDANSEADNDMYRHDHALYAKGKNIKLQNSVIYNIYAGYGVKVDGYATQLGQVPSDEFSHFVLNNTFGPNTNPNPYGQGKRSGSPQRPVNSTSGSYRPRWFFGNNICLDLDGSPGCIIITDKTWSNFPTNNVCRDNVVQTPGQSGFLSTCGTHDAGVDPNVVQSGNLTGQSAAQLDMVNPGAFDYDLNAPSTAAGQGDCTTIDNLVFPTDDKDGVTRGSPCDAGAFEAP